MNKRPLIKALAAACMTVMSAAQADQIVGISGPDVGTQSPAVQNYDFTSLIQFGYGGLNHGNVVAEIIDTATGDELPKVFDTASGLYSDMVLGDSFMSDLYNDSFATKTGELVGKAWPVGEPSGIKVLTDTDTTYESNGKPASCIMSTSFHPFADDDDYVSGTVPLPAGATVDDGYLGTNVVNPTMCNSAFQTHKRFKVNALPGSVADDGTGNPVAIDMVFNVNNEATPQEDATNPARTMTRYAVLQKLNNYTDKHLSGFKLQVGTGVGTSFTKSSDANVLALSDGAGEQEKVNKDTDELEPTGADIFDVMSRATFSAGLFGPADPPKHPDPGFFDNTLPAGFYTSENVDKNEIASTGDILAVGETVSTYEKLFGSKWLPSIYEPKGIFWDFDNDPATDDQVVAWWGDNPNTDAEDYMWLKGAADNYAPVTAAELDVWATSTEPYYINGIEDVLNLGLNYIIDLGDLVDEVAQSGTFTLRMIPLVDETRADFVPGFTQDENQPPASLDDYILPDDDIVSSSDGGGFCSYNADGRFDPVLPAIILAALAYLGWRIKKRAR